MLELSHKKLLAWQRAVLLLPLVYDACRRLPKEEQFNICIQMKRAALSISNNIAEGAARKTKKDKNHFFIMARSSATEVDNCLVACLALKYFRKDDIKALGECLVEVFRLISGLIASNEE